MNPGILDKEQALIKGWVRPKFDPEQEKAYEQHLLGRMIILSWVSLGIGALAFIFIGYWDWLLDPDATRQTFVIRAAVTLYFAVIAFRIPKAATSPVFWLLSMFIVYQGVAVALNLILAQLPNG